MVRPPRGVQSSFGALVGVGLVLAVASPLSPRARADGACGDRVTPFGATRRIETAGLGCGRAERVVRSWLHRAQRQGSEPRRVSGFRCEVLRDAHHSQRVVCADGSERLAFTRVLGATRLRRLQPYAADSPFNRPIPAGARIDPRSSPMVRSIVDAVRRRGSTLAWRQWSVPVYFADAATRRRTVRLTAPWAPRRRLLRVPIPAYAAPDPRDDGHMTIVDTAAGCEYDFWQARERGRRWRASWGNAIRLRGPGVFSAGLSARGSGFGLLAGLIWPYELRRGRIDHALAFSYLWPRRGGPVPPATESDGSSRRRGAIPEGARVRLDPSVDVDSLGLRPYERTIARALQRYGAYLVDGGSGFAVYAVHPLSARTDPYVGLLPDRSYPSLDGIPIRRLQVLKLAPQHRPSVDLVPNGCARFR